MKTLDIVNKIPSNPSDFNSETGFGEPQHFVSLPKGRTLEIIHEDTGDGNRWFLWQVYANEKEMDKCDNFYGIIDEAASEDISVKTKTELVKWALNLKL